MSSKRRYLILLLILWLPMQGLAATLLHCAINPAETVSDEHFSLHQHHALIAFDEIPEQNHDSMAGNSHHDAGHKNLDSQHFDLCQQCCQVCTTLIPSSALSDNQVLATPVTWPAERADSIISDPLFHPPQDLS